MIRIAADSKTHINAMDMDANYSDSDNPLKLKADFMFSLCEQLMGAGHIGTKEKTIIDRCTTITYREYLKNNFTGTPPTLKDFHKVRHAQLDKAAHAVAYKAAYFCHRPFGHMLRAEGKVDACGNVAKRVQNRSVHVENC